MYTRSTKRTLLAALVALPLTVGSAAAASATPNVQPTSSASSTSSADLSTPALSTVAPSSASTIQVSSAPASPVSSTSSAVSSTVVPRAMNRMAVNAAPAAISVGSHVSRAVDSDVLGAPIAAETHWGSAGGGWAQQFQNGWAMVSDGGQVGMVTGDLLSYFNSHGYVNATGWPDGNAVTDGYGTYQKFDSKGSVISGALMSSSAGTFRVFGGMYAMYFGQGLRSALGSATGEESRWSSGGGGWAQSFAKGWELYKSMSVNGYVPSSFPWPDLNKLGWPKGGPQSTCGGQGIIFEHGTWMSNGSTCAPAKPPVTPPAKPVTGGGYTLSPGWNGVKAFLAQQALHIPYSPDGTRMGPQTVSALTIFQSKHGLKANGILDRDTFTALNTGYSFDVDAWKQPSKVSSRDSRTTRANAAAAFARAQAGKDYIWGGTGPMGYDCAGLVLQAMRAGGFDPKNVWNYFDVYPDSDLSDKMWRDTSEFQRESSSAVAVGDLAFWGYGGKVHHVAMYLGNGQWAQSIDDGSGVIVTSGGIGGAQARNKYGSSNLFGYARVIR